MLTRLRLAAGIALFAILAAPLAHAQNPPTKGARNGGGGGPGGGGPGGGGPGGGGPGGFGGGPGGFGGGPGGFGGRGAGPANDSAERLLQIVAVQDDLKLDDKTKAKIKTLGEDAVKERTRRRDKVTKAAAAQSAQLQAAQNQAMAEALAASGIMVDPKTLNNNNNNGGGRGGRGGNNGGPGGGPGGNNQLERNMMTAAMAALAEQVDTTLLKLLDAKQKTRLKQIILQQEGARAFTDPNQEVAEKLDLSEEQITAMRTANGQLRQSQQQARMDLMAQFIPADENGNTANNNNGGGGRGGRGGPGGGFQALANLDPVTRAKFDQATQQLQTQNNTAAMAAIGQLLTATQKKTYNKLIGDPFDLTKLRTAPVGPGGPGAPGTPGTPATTAATKSDTPAKTDTPAKKKSLREQRGGN